MAPNLHFRSDLFIQAKLWNSNHRPEHVEPDLDATLKDLKTTYVDSFVIHWPMACPSTGKNPTLRTNGNFPAHYSKGNYNYHYGDKSNTYIKNLYQEACHL